MRTTRRQFLRRLGVSAAALPFLPSFNSLAAAPGREKQRIIFMFSPNGVVQPDFWPDEVGEFFGTPPCKRILAPLAPFTDRLLTLKGISNKIRGDGDGHMRGMSCLLTAIELFPGNIQGGSDSPAGWASGISIDQEIKDFLQKDSETATRFGSLEVGVAVPNRADPWTRWAYAGPNQPLAPVSDPYELFEKLYGQLKDSESLGSVLDEVSDDLRTIAARLPADERALLEKHTTFVREMERDLQAAAASKLLHPAPTLEPGVPLDNDGMPKVSRMQVDLLVNALANDMCRVATLDFTNSVGQARMRWLGVDEGHHSLSHEPDSNIAAQEKLVRINTWFAQQLAMLANKLDTTPEPGGNGSMLDHTTIVWTNELGKGNSHSHDNIPFVFLGGGLGWKSGRALKYEGVPHNRLWLSVAHAFGHEIETFGNAGFSADGPMALA
jgi:hypothetical protein